MENPIKMDDLEGKPPIFGNIRTLPPRKDGRLPLPSYFNQRGASHSYPFRRELKGAPKSFYL